MQVGKGAKTKDVQRMHALMRMIIMVGVLVCGAMSPVTRADSQAGIMASGGIQALASAIFLVVGVIDIGICTGTFGSGEGGLLISNACAESAIAFLLGATSAVGAAQTLSAGDEQRAEEYSGEGYKAGLGSRSTGLGPGGKCTEIQHETCRRLMKIGKTKHLGNCGCTLVNMPVDPKTGKITNETLAKATPANVQKAMMDAARTGNYDSLNKIVGGNKVDKLKNMSPEELNERIKAVEESLEEHGQSLGGLAAQAQVGEDGVDLSDLEEVAAQAPKKVATPEDEEAFLTGGSKTMKLAKDPSGWAEDLSEAELKKRRDTWLKLAKNKKHGLIANDRIGLFYVIERRYNTMEKDEYQVKYYNIKRGKYMSVKRIDEGAPD